MISQIVLTQDITTAKYVHCPDKFHFSKEIKCGKILKLPAEFSKVINREAHLVVRSGVSGILSLPVYMNQNINPVNPVTL